MGRSRSPRPSWRPTAWAGPRQSHTHRGPHRRGVATGRGRAAYGDQGHGARQGAPEPSHGPTDSPSPAGPGRRDRSHQGLAPPRGWPLKGQTPVRPGLRSRHPAAAAPPFASPRVRPASPPPHKYVGGRSLGGAQVRGQDPVGSGLRSGSQLPSFRGSVPPPRRRSRPHPGWSPELCSGPPLFLRRDGA